MSLVGVYAAGLCMFLAGRPSIITCTRFLGNGPSRLQRSWWCVLRVRAYVLGLSTEGSWVSWSTGWSRIFGCNWHLSHSWFAPVGLSCQVALQTRLVISSPSFPPHWLIHLVCVLFPHPIHLPPSFPPHSLSLFVPHTSSSHFHAVPIALFSWLLPTFSSVVPSTDALSFSRD